MGRHKDYLYYLMNRWFFVSNQFMEGDKNRCLNRYLVPDKTLFMRHMLK